MTELPDGEWERLDTAEQLAVESAMSGDLYLRRVHVSLSGITAPCLGPDCWRCDNADTWAAGLEYLRQQSRSVEPQRRPGWLPTGTGGGIPEPTRHRIRHIITNGGTRDVHSG